MRYKIPAERAATLSALPLFQGCTSRELSYIDQLGDEVEVEAGTTLTREGQIGRQSFVILSGEAAVTLRDHPLARLGAGDAFGEMAVLTGQPRSATVTAVTPMRLLVLDPRSLSGLAGIAPVARGLLTAMIRRLQEAQGSREYA